MEARLPEQPAWMHEAPIDERGPSHDALYESAFESEDRPDNGGRGIGFIVFQAIELGTIVAAGLTVACSCWAFVTSPLGVAGNALRLYVAGLAACVLPLELNWRGAQDDMAALDNWLARGAFYMFIGCLSLSLNEKQAAVNDPSSIEPGSKLVTMTGIASAGMLLAGVGYILMGITCQKEKKEFMNLL